jgi:hypothetical protein
MTINAADFSVDTSGNLRSVSGTTVYTTLELHAWLQDLADNSAPAGDDNVSILGQNPSELAGKRNASRPMALTLKNGVNVDDATAQRFNFGSIEQTTGNYLYTGLKTIGTIIAGSPMYIMQNNAKVTSYWSAGHIQILLKAKTGNTLIDSGNVTVYSRKYGQTYSHFDANLAAGSEQSAAINTAIDVNVDTSTITPTVAASYFATAIGGTGGASPKIALTFGDTTQDLGGGQGSKLHKGTITLDGTITVAQAYQALMWACSESSTITFNSVPGWRYRLLNAAYAENVAAPMGTFAGGKWFVAQGWWLTGVQAGDSKNYQLIAHDGTVETPPNSIAISVGGVVAGDYVIAARDDGSGGFLNDTTLASTATVGATSVTLTAAPSDTPTGAGFIRIGGNAHTYTGRAGNVVSGLSPAVPSGGYASGTAVFIPFIDAVATGSTISSSSFQFGSNFTCRYRVRNGGGSPIVPFESTLSVTSTGGSGTAVRNADV